MKLISFLSTLFLLVQCCFSQTHNNSSKENTSFLKGISFKYKYENGSAISISFSDEKLTYKWIEGPDKSKPAKTYPYRVSILSENEYYVNWHETDHKNFITLVFNLDKMEAFSSVIAQYQDDSPLTTFDSAIISELSNSNKKPALPFSEIPSYNVQYNSGNILKRMIEGLGYRYYWATEGLTNKDLDYKPSKDARNTEQTLEHIYGLSETILNAANDQPNIRPTDWSHLSFSKLRKLTLENLYKASKAYENKTAKEISALNIIIENNGNRNTFPFWNMINGPISDGLYHTGQIVSFRRSSGNPINSKVNVFLGKTRQ